MERYLLSRREAAERYGLSQTTLDKLYRRDPTFPMIRVGKRVMIPWKQADAWFSRNQIIEIKESPRVRQGRGGNKRTALEMLS